MIYFFESLLSNELKITVIINSTTINIITEIIVYIKELSLLIESAIITFEIIINDILSFLILLLSFLPFKFNNCM